MIFAKKEIINIFHYVIIPNVNVNVNLKCKTLQRLLIKKKYGVRWTY